MIPIKLPKEQKEQLVHSLQTYFKSERAETIGNLEAEQMIDFMIAEMGPFVYNKAIEDARTVINQKMLQIEDELYTLEKPIQRR